jgi:N-carbamoylputrescine amidase
MRTVSLAALQFSCSWTRDNNIAKADRLVRQAARQGAQVVLQGAEFLMYPTAIGTEPNDPSLDSMEHWRIVMRGHAGANMVPVVAANRIGLETTEGVSMTFYGSSFIADHLGALAVAADRTSEQVLVQKCDLERCRAYRQSWGCFRDRRPDLYGALTTLDGSTGTAAEIR